jgi:purine nucleosidase
VIPVLFDTDLGTDVDDAIALAYLAKSARFDLLGVTTVNGDVRRRAELATAILRLAGRDDVPVGIGASAPLDGATTRSMPAGLVATGPADALPDDVPSADDVIVEALSRGSAPVHVCAVGAFTNVAAVLRSRPDLLERVAGLHLMGGCLLEYALVAGGAAHEPVPEFNLNGDATAAAVCLSLPVPLRIVPLDATNVLAFDDDDRATIASAGELGAVLAEQMSGWCEMLRSRSDDPDVPRVRLHDPLTVVGIALSDIEEREELRIALHGRPGRAFLVTSPHGRSATVVRSADSAALRQELVEVISG